MKSCHFMIFLTILVPNMSQLYKQVYLEGNSWPSKIKRSVIAKTNVECASVCFGDLVNYDSYENWTGCFKYISYFFSTFQCDFFVLNKETEDCYIGNTVRTDSELPDEADKRTAYVDVGKICTLFLTAS